MTEYRTAAIILTLNEEIHIRRAVLCAFRLADDVYVIDAQSTDRTAELARELGAHVLVHPWTDHATQFNWALTQVSADTDWVIRLDADEFVDDELINDFRAKKKAQLSGLTFGREIHFCGKRIRHGGLFPMRIVRAFRLGHAHCEQRLMDEHIIVRGRVGNVSGLLIDQNLKPLDWWIAKHNRYATLEAAASLRERYATTSDRTIGAKGQLALATRFRRWLKKSIYMRLPSGFRARLYYTYRAYVRLGIIGSKEERIFHFLQGYWYRYLVDAKIAEMEKHMLINGRSVDAAITNYMATSAHNASET